LDVGLERGKKDREEKLLLVLDKSGYIRYNISAFAGSESSAEVYKPPGRHWVRDPCAGLYFAHFGATPMRAWGAWHPWRILIAGETAAYGWDFAARGSGSLAGPEFYAALRRCSGFSRRQVWRGRVILCSRHPVLFLTIYRPGPQLR